MSMISRDNNAGTVVQAIQANPSDYSAAVLAGAFQTTARGS